MTDDDHETQNAILRTDNKWLKWCLGALSMFALGDRAPEFLAFVLKVMELK